MTPTSPVLPQPVLQPVVPPLAAQTLSVNALAAPLVRQLLAEADALGVHARIDASGVCIVDAGIDCRGSIAAGLRVAEICMGGLGRVTLRAGGLEG